MSDDGAFDDGAALLPAVAVARTDDQEIRDRRCRNCGARVTEPYCGRCGQRSELRPLSLGSLLWELLIEILDSDARVWRTLRTLLLRPGQLTLAWAEGRRLRYMPPFRLYLVLNVLVFLVLSAQFEDEPLISDEGRALARVELQEQLDALAGEEGPGAERRRAGLRRALATLAADAGTPEPDAEPAAEADDGAQAAGERTSGLRISSEEISLGGAEDWLVDLGYPRERIDAVKQSVLEDPRGAAEDIYERLPLVMFLLLPFLAAILRGFYLPSRRPFVLHLVGLVHLHAFAFLLMLFNEGFIGFGMLLTSVGLESAQELGEIVPGVASIILPIYVARWFMVLYGHGIPMALFMTVLVSLLHLVGAALGLVSLVLGSFVSAVVFGA